MTSYIPLKILSKKEKEELATQLEKQFGIKNAEGIFLMRGQERIFLFQGSLTEKQIKELENAVPVERVGVYFGKNINGQIRLSIEGTQMLKNQITKNIFELDDKQLELWMKGQEILIETGKNDFLVMKYKDNFLGCGKASEKKITNFIPKNRRLREKNN